MASEPKQIVIVGASLAGLRAAETLRQEKYTGRIVMVSNEAAQPYDRPPLSKKVLAGEWEPDRIRLRKPDDLASLDAEWILGDAAVRLDSVHRQVVLASGRVLDFDGLIVATGGRVRRLPDQPNWSGIHVLRSLDDSLALRSELVADRRVVVIGAGFIGLEVAATARGLGCEVAVLEGAEAPLMRGLGVAMGRLVAKIHPENGVDLRCGVKVARLVEREPGVVGGVELDDGSVVPADVVVVGIGVAPATEWLTDSGLVIRDGVVCDETLNAGLPGVYAAGDVARWPNQLLGEEVRVEHWTNASEQGAAAARNLLAVARGETPDPYAEVPFFWSDQFGVRIQFLGRAAGDEEIEIVVGSPEENSFVALYHRDGLFRAALGVSRPKQLMPFRKLLAERATWDQARELAASFGT
jgi:NADPH-dependent 2,4-dienoyl-CoA reductase/sulfur reductase-like enzyme